MDKMTKAEIQVRGILDGRTNAQILADVTQAYPDASTSKACVAWYRNKVKNPGKTPSVDKMVERILAEASVVETGDEVGDQA
jgi:hypothetical protein